MTLTPPRDKGIVIDSPRKRCSINLEMLEKKRKKLEYEVLTLFFDKELKEKFDRSWAGKKWFIGDTLISLRSNLFNILHFIKK